MFDAIRESLDQKPNDGSSGAFKEILKFKAGNTYQVRLVPNQNAPKESIFHYYNHGWNSVATGKYVGAMCPTTFGDTCPIDAYYLKTYRSGTESEKEASKVLSRKENWLANVYVISDPENPENEGKVKILRYGRELHKIIESALKGDDAKEVGIERAFDIADGCTLRIKCETKADKGKNKITTYVASKFLSPSSLDLDEDEVQAILDAAHDLKTVNKQTTPAEMQRLLDEHFFCLSTGSAADVDEDEDPAPVVKKKAEAPKTKTKPVTVSEDEDEDEVVAETESADESTDEALKKLLADL